MTQRAVLLIVTVCLATGAVEAQEKVGRCPGRCDCRKVLEELDCVRDCNAGSGTLDPDGVECDTSKLKGLGVSSLIEDLLNTDQGGGGAGPQPRLFVVPEAQAASEQTKFQSVVAGARVHYQPDDPCYCCTAPVPPGNDPNNRTGVLETRRHVPSPKAGPVAELGKSLGKPRLAHPEFARMLADLELVYVPYVYPVGDEGYRVSTVTLIPKRALGPVPVGEPPPGPGEVNQDEPLRQMRDRLEKEWAERVGFIRAMQRDLKGSDTRFSNGQINQYFQPEEERACREFWMRVAKVIEELRMAEEERNQVRKTQGKTAP